MNNKRLNIKDSKAFNEVFDKYYLELKKFLLNYSEDKNLIDDILQETFVEVHSRIGALKNSPDCRERIYATAIRYTKKLNNRYYREEVGEIPVEMVEEEVEWIAENLEIIKQILSEDEYNLVELIYIKKFRVREVAESIGTTYTALCTKLNRIREKIRVKFKNM